MQHSTELTPASRYPSGKQKHVIGGEYGRYPCDNKESLLTLTSSVRPSLSRSLSLHQSGLLLHNEVQVFGWMCYLRSSKANSMIKLKYATIVLVDIESRHLTPQTYKLLLVKKASMHIPNAVDAIVYNMRLLNGALSDSKIFYVTLCNAT